MASGKLPSFDSSSSEDSGKLGEISCKLEPRTGKIPLAGRCHRLPKRLESDYIMTSKILGTGYNGKVHLAKSRINSKQTVAVKTFRLKGLKESKKERLIAETSVFLCMDHPHVARLLDVYETENHMSLVMECMEGGELFDRVTNVKRFTESGAADVTRQMLLGLNYLHSHGMVHRDLKLENFLFDCQDGNHLKMIDFGFSKFTDTKGRMKTSCGTLAYVAPEVLKRSYNSQCDLWSMGVMVFILLSGHMPFHGDSDEQIGDIKKGKYSFQKEHWANVSKDGQSFTRALLEIDPSKRLSARAALDHHWLQQSFQDAIPQLDASILIALKSWSLAPKLHRVCMSMMAWSLTNQHHAQVRDHFLALDRNHDGVISLDELREAMGRGGCESDEDILYVFDSLTHGHEGEMHYSDFLAAMACSHLELHDELLQVTFKKFDRHNSGFITPQDLENILGKEDEDVETLICEVNLNGEVRLDYPGFADYVRSSRIRLLAQQCAGNANSFQQPLPNAPVLLGRAGVPLCASPAHKALVKEVPVDKAPPACCVLQ